MKYCKPIPLPGICALALLCLLPNLLPGQISVSIKANSEPKKISPYLYGRNNSFFSTGPPKPLSHDEVTRLKDAGVRFFRESGGNNSSKYNWRKKLSSHPDWYNNVYTNDWDRVALELQAHFPDAQGMWAFPLLGYAARSDAANFPDWNYNRSQWWEGVRQNLAGGGIPSPSGTKAQKDGDIHLYLREWSPDSSVAILDHWFGSDGIGLNREKITYWSMDNEPEIWSGTHDDVMPEQLSPQEFMQRYIETAKKARAKFPGIRLAGPVAANEWQWYNWDGKGIMENGRSYPWLEYFIKAIAEEEKKSGIRLLDVLAIHFYPSTRKPEEVVQLHRVLFDRTYDFPEANGVKTINGGYDNSITKEYILGRCSDWLTQYLGKDHGVSLGLTEAGLDEGISPSVTAVWYASMLGELMKNDVSIFSPWHWKPGMWETLHLFSRYAKSFAVQASSSNETLVSAYPSIDAGKDSMTVILVNRSVDREQAVAVEFDGFHPLNEIASSYTLSGLPAAETFYSKDRNALKSSDLNVIGRKLSLTVPPMSVTAVLLRGGGEVLGNESISGDSIVVFPNPAQNIVTVKWQNRGKFKKISVADQHGRLILSQPVSPSQQEVNISLRLPDGTYLIILWDENDKPALSKTFISIQ